MFALGLLGVFNSRQLQYELRTSAQCRPSSCGVSPLQLVSEDTGMSVHGPLRTGLTGGLSFRWCSKTEKTLKKQGTWFFVADLSTMSYYVLLRKGKGKGTLFVSQLDHTTTVRQLLGLLHAFFSNSQDLRPGELGSGPTPRSYCPWITSRDVDLYRGSHPPVAN